MSEIASKTYTEAGSSLAQPFAKKGAATEHDVMFAALFGGVVATQSDAEPLAAELKLAHAGADADANPDGNTDILMAMQAVAAMLSGQPAKRQNSDMNAADGEAGGEAGDALPDALEEVAEREQHDALDLLVAQHRVRLARARRAVREDRGVVPQDHAVDEELGGVVVDGPRGRALVKREVERVALLP